MTDYGDQLAANVGPISQSAMMRGDWVVFGARRVPAHRRVSEETCEARRLHMTADENPSEFVDAAINLRAAGLNARDK